MALDAAIIALVIGQKCIRHSLVERVRDQRDDELYGHRKHQGARTMPAELDKNQPG